MSFMNVPKNVGRRGAPFIAPGGSQVGNYMVHVYTSNGTFVPESEGVIEENSMNDQSISTEPEIKDNNQDLSEEPDKSES